MIYSYKTLHSSIYSIRMYSFSLFLQLLNYKKCSTSYFNMLDDRVMASARLEVVSDDQSPHKWCVPLKEDVFGAFMAKGGPVMHKVFGDKSLFGPLLFKKFFDPSDAFPLWEFEPGVLCDPQNACVDWFQTEACYILKTKLPDVEKSSIRVYVENGKDMEISGLWNHKGHSRTTDWRSGKWWECGFVRKLELPENVDWKKIEAYVNNTAILDIRLPKTSTECDTLTGKGRVINDLASASS